MNLTKQQVSTKLQTAKTVDAIKLDSDENTQLLIRKLDDKVRQAKMKLQKNEGSNSYLSSVELWNLSHNSNIKRVYTSQAFFLRNS